ncbi:hypothetical protein [Lewinella sp. 4G2]|uniref:hypothetical protein n=1 Tax=Lewinella sp. 4G2 TaxID=1803372 RepID=UPI0007B4E665|nr:hypothetical protein [Lewinella sp. 4G2]OAV43753.1 hypothetical protein A3850_004240 [Lewinella sp. 4G2]
MPDKPHRPQRSASPGFRKRVRTDQPVAPAATGPSPAEIQARDTAHEADLVSRLSQLHGQELAPGQLKVEEATVRVGYLNAAAGLAFEVYPKRKGNNSGIKRKITADILKLALLKKHWAAEHGDKVVCAIVLGDAAAVSDYIGVKGPSWMRRAAEQFGVEVITMD